MRYFFPVIASFTMFPGIAMAQKSNPFESIGKKAEVQTLSGGRYQETFDDDVQQRVGSVIIDRRTKKIIKLLNSDSINTEMADNSSASRWYSIDPLAQKYPSISPYAFCANNPIMFVDPDGRKVTLASTKFDNDGNRTLLTLASFAGEYSGRVSAENGQVTVNTEGLSQEQISSEPGFQLLINAVSASENILVEMNDVAEGIDRNTGEAISLVVYDPLSNPGGKVDLNFSITSRGADDKSSFLSKPRNSGEAVWNKFDALPKNGYDGQVTIPPNLAGMVDSKNRRQVTHGPVLFHAFAEVYERTVNKKPFQEAHQSSQALEGSLPETNVSKSPSPGSYSIEQQDQREYKKSVSEIK